MSDVDNAIKIGNFRLNAFEKIVRLQIDVAKARADIAEKLEDITKKKIKNAESQLRLRQLEAAIKRFKIELRKANRKQKTLENKLANFQRIQTRLASLALGELITPSQVRYAWLGLDQTVRIAAREAGAVDSPKVSVSDRMGEHYFCPHEPSKKIKDAPKSNKVAIILFLKWAAPKKYVPKMGTPPFEKLQETIQAFNSAFGAAAASVAVELDVAKEKFNKLSETSFQKTIDPVKESKKLA